MKIGKVSNKILENIIINPINNSNINRKEVIIRPSIGEDCTALNIKDEYCVLSTDPITGAVENIGNLAVYINTNDIASSGAVPIGIMVTILLPPNSSENELKKIMSSIYSEASKIGIEILGGHTEVTDAVNKPVISCTVIGKTVNKKFISSSGAKLGQSVIMTKWAGLEGTSIIANDHLNKLKGIIDDNTIKSACDFKESLSVIKESEIALKNNATCMHDVTEGGILGACWEIAECSKTGIEIYIENIPVAKETEAICSYFNINPYRLISSGCLIITANEAEGEKILKEINNIGIKASLIGKIIEDERILIKNGKKYILDEPESDELYKIK